MAARALQRRGPSYSQALDAPGRRAGRSKSARRPSPHGHGHRAERKDAHSRRHTGAHPQMAL
eukprot:5536031-Pyramimonas_sp.AAC.1